MPAISAAYAAALPYSHQIATLAQVWTGGGTLLKTFKVEPGSQLTVDVSAATRRSLSCSLIDADGTLTPTGAGDVFAPFGNEIILWRGITYPSGAQELVQLGVFGIETVDIVDTKTDLVINLTAPDRAQAFARAKLIDVYSIAPNTNIATAIQALLQSVNPGPAISYAFAQTAFVTPNAPIIYKAGDNPWAEATALATACGMQLYFDPYGVCTLRPVADPRYQQSVWSYDEGPRNIVTKLTRTLTRTKVANYVIRDGQGTGIAVPVRGLAFDSNPLSATRIGGPFGTVVDYLSSSLYTTQAQANAAAAADLALMLGSVEGVSFSAVPKPDHEVGEVFEVTRSRVRATNAFYVLDSFTLSLDYRATLDGVARRVGRAA